MVLSGRIDGPLPPLAMYVRADGRTAAALGLENIFCSSAPLVIISAMGSARSALAKFKTRSVYLFEPFCSLVEMKDMAAKYAKRSGLSSVDIGVRKVASTLGKASFLTHAAKAQGIRVVESQAERLVANMLGFEPSVRSFQTQPLTVDLIDGAILRTTEQRSIARKKHAGLAAPIFYTPDFSAVLSCGRSDVMEVKLDKHPGNDEYQRMLGLASDILFNHGCRFTKIVVPSYWKHPLWTNVALIHQALMRKDLCPTETTFEDIERLQKGGATTGRDYCKGLGLSPRMLPVLLAFGALSIDLLAFQISADAPAAPAYGALDHLELIRRLEQ